MLTRNGFKLEAAWEIINCLECGYSGYLCELHNEVFNTDYYETYNPAAKKWFDEYDLSVFDVVDEIITYEKDNFGEVNTDFSNPCAVLNMYWYIIGHRDKWTTLCHAVTYGEWEVNLHQE